MLGIWLKRTAFDRILSHSVASGFIPDVHGSKAEYDRLVHQGKLDPFGFVRRQWDPGKKKIKNLLALIFL